MDRLDLWSFRSRSRELDEDLYFGCGAQEMTDYRNPVELLAALKQKEEEVILAAELGNALLLENRQLKEQSDKLHEQYADKLEVRGSPRRTQQRNTKSWAEMCADGCFGMDFSFIFVKN